jgi:hypothetical protein
MNNTDYPPNIYDATVVPLFTNGINSINISSSIITQQTFTIYKTGNINGNIISSSVVQLF